MKPTVFSCPWYPYITRLLLVAAYKLLVNRIEQLLQLVELQVCQQDLSLDVVHHLKRDVSTFVKRLCDHIDSHCHPVALPFDGPL